LGLKNIGGERNMPKITCPNCGTTIDLETRRKTDFSLILNALKGNPKRFTDLLHATRLPRKTLSIRLKDLRSTELISKHEGFYHLNNASEVESSTVRMYPFRRGRDWRQLMELLCLGLVLCLLTTSIAAALVSIPTYEPVLSPPTASFTVNPQSYYIGWGEKALTFDASPSYDTDGNITKYYWKFGDGSFGNDVITTHEYQSPGRYTVELTIIDDAGLVSKATEEITVFPTPCMRIYPDVPDVTGLTVNDTFTVNIVISEVTNLRAWQFGMTFNPKVLECVTTEILLPDTSGNWEKKRISAFTEGPFLKQGGQTLFVAPDKIYESDGVIRSHGCCIFVNSTSVSGSGTLASITFRILAPGASTLHITKMMLLDFDLNKIPVLAVDDGYFQLP
jgi:hypothetical protein